MYTSQQRGLNVCQTALMALAFDRCKAIIDEMAKLVNTSKNMHCFDFSEFAH